MDWLKMDMRQRACMRYAAIFVGVARGKRKSGARTTRAPPPQRRPRAKGLYDVIHVALTSRRFPERFRRFQKLLLWNFLAHSGKF